MSIVFDASLTLSWYFEDERTPAVDAVLDEVVAGGEFQANASASVVDTLTPERRSTLLRLVGGKDTAPEMIVRRLVHGLGFRYRLHRKGLPGRPDLVFPIRRKAIFVHGCFWRGHGCKIGRLPKSRPEYWGPKIARNRQRDVESVAALDALGWETLTVWQCEAKDCDALALRIVEFLRGSSKSRST